MPTQQRDLRSITAVWKVYKHRRHLGALTYHLLIPPHQIYSNQQLLANRPRINTMDPKYVEEKKEEVAQEVR
jgi:hypothetical protein